MRMPSATLLVMYKLKDNGFGWSPLGDRKAAEDLTP